VFEDEQIRADGLTLNMSGARGAAAWKIHYSKDRPSDGAQTHLAGLAE